MHFGNGPGTLIRICNALTCYLALLSVYIFSSKLNKPFPVLGDNTHGQLNQCFLLVLLHPDSHPLHLGMMVVRVSGEASANSFQGCDYGLAL